MATRLIRDVVRIILAGAKFLAHHIRLNERQTEFEYMSSKIFVGGLSWGTDDSGLQEAFESFGEITDAKVISDRETGRSRGFGFVTFRNAEDANSAIEAMNGAVLDGRTLNVNQAQERNDRGPRGGGGGGGGRDGGGRGGYGGGGGGSRW